VFWFYPVTTTDHHPQYLYWSIITYNLSLTSIKVSIILQYKRIFTVREMRLPLYVALGICVAW
jgi:hypothetical protein